MENLRGIILMVASMAGFAVEDMFIKFASDDLNPGIIMMTLGVGGALLFSIAVRLRGERIWGRDLFSAPVLLRNFGEVFGSIGFITAISRTDLSSASAILQALPLAVTLGAALFLGESVGWRRWTAIFVGFCGVMMVVRPGLAGFDVNSLFAVQGVIGLGLRDVATRKVPKSLSSMRLAVSALLMLSVTGAVLGMFLGDIHQPSGSAIFSMTAAVLIGAVSYYAIIIATRIGEISVIAPFRYSRLIFALIIGIVVFNENPDFWTLTGAAIIMTSGIYTFLRERRLRVRLAALPLGPMVR